MLVMASRVTLLLVMCVLPAMVAAIRPAKNPYRVKGRVYCDLCRTGFESTFTSRIAGAEVMLQCKNRISNEVVYTKRGWTDSTGAYTIFVGKDHADKVCHAKLVRSPDSYCREPIPGRDQTPVILTRYNGNASDDRFANGMGFMKQKVSSGCAQIFKLYQAFNN